MSIFSSTPTSTALDLFASSSLSQHHSGYCTRSWTTSTAPSHLNPPFSYHSRDCEVACSARLHCPNVEMYLTPSTGFRAIEWSSGSRYILFHPQTLLLLQHFLFPHISTYWYRGLWTSLLVVSKCVLLYQIYSFGATCFPPAQPPLLEAGCYGLQ